MDVGLKDGIQSRLKFYGRVKKASKRNFQLVFREDEDDAQGELCYRLMKCSESTCMFR